MSNRAKIGIGVFAGLMVLGLLADDPEPPTDVADAPADAASPPPAPDPPPPRAEDLLARIDDLGASDAILRVRAQDGVAWVTISDAWYHIPCYQRQRVAKGFRSHWRSLGGSQIVIDDVAGTELADFRIFSDDFDIAGC